MRNYLTINSHTVTSHFEASLHDFAIWSNAEDFEIFFSKNDNIVGVSIPVGEDIAEVLEAGSALGFCNGVFEVSGLSSGNFGIHSYRSHVKIIN